MTDLIERLRERAEFEDKRVLDEAKALGFVPELYAGSQTGALLLEAAAALEAAREDAERLDWMASEARMLSGWRDTGRWEMPAIQIDSTRERCTPDDLRKAIDAEYQQAIDQARGKESGNG